MLKSITFVIGLVLSCSASFAAPAEIRVCVSSQPPFWKTLDGKPAGIEYDILRDFAESQGAQLKIVEISGILTKLQEGVCDVGAGRLTITKEREKSVSFSVPYFSIRVAVVMRKGEGVTNVKGLEGKRIVLMAPTNMDLTGAVIVHTDGEQESSKMLQAHEIDAATMDSTMLDGFLKGQDYMELAFFLPQRETYGFPLRKGDPLKQALDEFIDKIKKDGSYEKILIRHLGAEMAALILESQ